MNTFCLAIAAPLVNVAMQGILLTAALSLALRLVPQVSAKVRSLVWSLAFVLLIGLHFVPRATAVTTYHVQPGWATWLAGAWLAASLWRGLQFADAVVRLHGLCRRAVPLGESVPVWRHRSALLCVSAEVHRPTVAGFFRPRVLLPASLLADISLEEREYVLLHEVTHLRRADNWTNLLQKLALIVFPLDPALLWIERRLCREREFACDEQVIAETRAPRSYALCLTSLAERGMFARASSLALGAWQRRSELVDRVEQMLRPVACPSRTRNTTAGTLLCSALLAGVFFIARQPQMVSFAAPFVTALASTNDAGAPLAGARMVLTSARVQPRSVNAMSQVHGEAKRRTTVLRPALHHVSKQKIPCLQSTMYLPQVVHHGHTPVRSAGFLQTGSVSNTPLPVFVPITTYAVATPDGWLVITI